MLGWRPENRIVSAGSTAYTYDGNSLRVKSGSGKLYWRGMGVDTLAESDLSGNITDEFIYFAGRKVARRTAATGAVAYYFSNHLGSTGVLTNATGTILEESDYYPFGRERIIVNSDPNLYKFTGYERDVETGLNYAMLRYQHETHGRFMSPDPLAGSVANPQSLNRYAYVLNNPVDWVDPLGLEEREPPGDPPHYLIVDARTLMLGSNTASSTCYSAGIQITCGVVERLLQFGHGGSAIHIALQWTGTVWGYLNVGTCTDCDPNRPLLIPIIDWSWQAVAYDAFNPHKYFMNHARRVRQARREQATKVTPIDAQQIFTEVGQTAGQVIHPCTIGLFYGASAGVAVYGSISTGGAVFAEIYRAGAAAAGTATIWAQRIPQPLQRMIATTIGGAIQSACD